MPILGSNNLYIYMVWYTCRYLRLLVLPPGYQPDQLEFSYSESYTCSTSTCAAPILSCVTYVYTQHPGMTVCQ